MRVRRFCTGRVGVVGLMLVWLAVVTASADTRSLAEIRAGKRVADVEGEATADAVASTNDVDEASGGGKVPAGWLRGAGPSGYERALELQTETGKDMLLLFFRETPADEKGLLRWFEKKSLNDARVQKQLRQYVKVRIDAGQTDRRTRELLEEHKVGKTPRLVMRRPNGFTRRVDVFTWPGGEPELVPPSDLVESLKAAGSPVPE